MTTIGSGYIGPNVGPAQMGGMAQMRVWPRWGCFDSLTLPCTFFSDPSTELVGTERLGCLIHCRLPLENGPRLRNQTMDLFGFDVWSCHLKRLGTGEMLQSAVHQQRSHP